MKRIVFVLILTGVLMAFVFNLSSCEKERTSEPKVAFIAGSTYISSDDTLFRGTIFNVKVNASKVGLSDLLTSGKITRSVNGGADSTMLEMNFFTQNFSQYYSYTAGDSGNVEKYTFTFGTQSGLYASSSISITVN
ncbi:MAG: hypothetical protein U0T74_00600 [Chitinophagales bacterium]